MKIDNSSWVRTIVSGFIITAIIVILKLIFGLIPDIVPVLACLIVPPLLLEVKNIEEVIIKGALTGVFAGLALSVIYLALFVFIFVVFIIFSIIGLLVYYFLKEKMSVI